jgi:hypothetical protein
MDKKNYYTVCTQCIYEQNHKSEIHAKSVLDDDDDDDDVTKQYSF